MSEHCLGARRYGRGNRLTLISWFYLIYLFSWENECQVSRAGIEVLQQLDWQVTVQACTVLPDYSRTVTGLLPNMVKLCRVISTEVL